MYAIRKPLRNAVKRTELPNEIRLTARLSLHRKPADIKALALYLQNLLRFLVLVNLLRC